SNTSRLIDEFMDNLDQFNAEKEAKLTRIREEEELKRAEEAKRLNEIKAAQEKAYHTQEANLGQDILETQLKEDREADKFIHSSGFTKGEALPLNSNESIAQKALSADEAISILQSIEAKQVPKELDIEGFLKELESVENKENFISHLSKKEDAKSRLAYLNLVKPTLEEADLILKTKNKFDEPTKEFIKAFQDENKRFFYIVITEQDNEKKLLTAFKTNKLRELKNRIEKARDFGEISSAHRFIKSPTAENILKQKSLNLTEKLYLKDNDNPLKVEYKIVNKDEIKPSFELSKTQFRSEKQEDLIAKIKKEFNPDLLVNIRGDLKKGNPIITQEGEVLSGNHRAAALKELRGENLSKYQNAVKEAFGVELKENEMLVRVVSEDTSEAQIKRFSAASNEGLENNLGEQGVSLFAKYQDKIKDLKETKRPFIAEDVYNLKYLVNKALGESSITKENDTSKALFASLARGRNNTILKALNELEKENLEQVSKTANMFFDNAGAFYNLTHDLEMPKMQNLQNYFSDVLVSAAKADYTRAEDFTKLNEDIRAFLDSADKEAMLKLSPNLVSDLLTKALGAGFARFARLENPSASLFEFLKGLKAELIEKGAPDLFSGGKGVELKERDEFDFAKELILKGQDSEAKFKLYANLEELKAWGKKQSVKDERVELKEALRGVLNQDITNESTGIKARIGIRELNKISSDKAITKSLDNGFSREEHFEASKHLDTLFKKAILREKHKDSKGRENIEAVYRFESVYKNANAKITVLEKIEGNNKIYTLELESLEPAPLNANALNKETEALTQSVESGHNQSTTIAKTDEQSIAQKSPVLNDEPLEVEIIEEASLNEPMKFLEFQQRKLLTYIKQNTPLRLLEHKKELKTRELLNFLEQSALNGKEKAFLMRHLERDLDKIEAKIKEKESVKESETIDNAKEQSLFNEEANFKANFEYETQEAKQKTINKVDEYTKSEAFKALSKDKQEAILSLKSIKPSIMPENIKIQDLQHLQEHFKGKLDEKQREKFLSLFNDTKQNADLVLEVLKNGEKRQEYIKAYQHKESKDLYYIAISKDERDITGIPTTQIQKIINDIAKSERVIKAENFGEISNTAAPLPKQTSPQRS
ncbi:PBECR2 nuclease fold domain-containing protein, partial [Campylobacter upsaliensis]|uniref:LPD3 domain-containing protein n=1 Tax=Campylobacter upsaliensis TaxID=28080 RepID=UPI00214A606C